MNEQKNEFIGLRLSVKHKAFLKQMAVKEGLSIPQWLRKQVVIQTWENLKRTAGKDASIQVAVEFGVPYQQARKLDDSMDALHLLPAEKGEDFLIRYYKVYDVILEEKRNEAGYLGMEEEIRLINALRVTA
jgi:hypothetical protein